MNKLHPKSRSNHPAYPDRTRVSDQEVSWLTYIQHYAPRWFNHPSVLENDCSIKKDGWADPQDYQKAYLMVIKRKSIEYGKQRNRKDDWICFSERELPINPIGRTGIWGRGLLGKWGPNMAADPIVTRKIQGKYQMIAILRKDLDVWAIPGGMVDAGEDVNQTLKREFTEEAANNPKLNPLITKLFSNQNAKIIYRGYVDDPRNTDNSWIETTAKHFHCSEELAKQLDNIGLKAGSDARSVKWLDISEKNPEYKNLYADHKLMVNKAISLMDPNYTRE